MGGQRLWIAWAIVEQVGNRIWTLLAVHRQVFSLGQEHADQHFGVLVRAPLSWTGTVTEEQHHARIARNSLEWRVNSLP